MRVWMWIGLGLVMVSCSSVVGQGQVSLSCQEGWTNIGVHCYRLFPQQMAWDIAFDVCQRYGSRLLRVKDLDGKEAALGALSAGKGVSHFWLAYPSSISYYNQPPHDQHHHHHHQNHHHHHQDHLTVTPAFSYASHFPPPPTSQEVGHLADVFSTVEGQQQQQQQQEEEEAERGRVRHVNGTVTGTAGAESGQCVFARWWWWWAGEEEGEEEGGRRRRVVVWGVAPCSRLTAFLCQRSAAPAESFHCSHGGFIQQRFVCDGDDDCGDASDEIHCKDVCRHHIQGTSGMVVTPDGRDTSSAPGVPRHCLWLLEAPVGYNARLEFTDFATEPEGDEIVVLMGGLTVSASREVARFCGDSDGQRHFVSINNLLIVVFTSKNNATTSGFSATFTAVKAEGFEPHQELTGTTEPQDLLSPFYPEYLSGQDYVWVITAVQPYHILTLQIDEIDLSGTDIVEIRDGNSVYAPLLHVLTSWRTTEHVTHVQSTSRHLFIALRTRGLVTGRGFHFRYWQGCSIRLEAKRGSVVSPGYLIKGTNYPINQTCVYDVTVPELETATLIFDSVDIHNSDELRIESDGQWSHTVRGTDPPGSIDLSSGAFRLTFRSDDKLTGRGFSLRYSVGCPRLHTNSHTAVHPASLVHHFGSALTLTCSHGYAFPPPEPRPQSEAATSLTLECLFGGTWNTSGFPVCKAQCKPGWFYDERTESCEACPKDSYQSDVNATSCRPCPQGTVTQKEGTNSSSECKTACAVGQRYCRSLQGCEDCPKGTYQSLPAQFTCLPCPLFKTTPQAGSNSSALCSVAVMDTNTQQELDDQELIVVSFQDQNSNHHHHHHRHHHRYHYPHDNRPPSHDSTPRIPGSLLTILLPSRSSKFNTSSRDLPRTAPGWTPTRQTGSMMIPGLHLPQHASEAKDGQALREGDVAEASEESYQLKSSDFTNPGGSRLERTDVDTSEGSRRKSSSDVMTPEDSKVLAWEREEIKIWTAAGQQSERVHPGLSESERVKRETSQKGEEKQGDDIVCASCGSGSGSGDDPCNITTGESPCNATQDCVPDFNTFKCVCKAIYNTNNLGQCVEVPETHKLFLTTPLTLTFDPDLSLQKSMAFLTFQGECQEAFTDIFRGVEGWKAVQILYFRSEAGGNEQTIVVYALLFSVGATSELRVKVAQTVLQMERYGELQIGSRNLTLAGHSGVFDSLQHSFTSSDDVDWCGVASLHKCEGERECVDGGLRYTCQCPDSTLDLAGACVKVGAVVGGVIGGVVVIIIIIVVIVIVVRRRRNVPHAYSRPEEQKGEEGQQSYSALTAPHQDSTEDTPDEITEPADRNVYDESSGSVTTHPYDTFGFIEEGGKGSKPSPTPKTQQSDDIELTEQNVYNRVSGPVTTHQYETFRFGGEQGLDAGNGAGTSGAANPYANMAAEATASGEATLPVPSGRTSSDHGRGSGMYMNVGGQGSGQGGQSKKDHVYSNVGHQ